MSKSFVKDLRQILHPYIFVLKEGNKEDLLDYSLMMLQVTCPEIIKSPSRQPDKQPAALATELDACQVALAEALFQKMNLNQS